MLGIFGALFAIVFVLKSEKALLTHPKGFIAHSELKLIVTNILLMLVVIVPTLILLFVTVWKYRAKNSKAEYAPKKAHKSSRELILWAIPALIVLPMALVTWKATHKLDPSQPIASALKPLMIQVVALDWKWLFIYPEQGIAAVNLMQFPAQTPIRLVLSADGSPMNSFWLPQLSGQIYAMTGMVTPLHMIADEAGVFSGRAAEINGDGFADMTFVAKSTSQADFEQWVEEAKRSPLQLTSQSYDELARPSQNDPVVIYSDVERDLFHKIVMKYNTPR